MSEIVHQIIEICKAEAELHPGAMQERCGVIVAAGAKPKLIECTNISTTPQQQFKIAPLEWVHLIDTENVLEVWHTHPNESAKPSPADLVRLEKTALPWHIVSWPDGGHSYTVPTGYIAPYEGRVFAHGILDCYALCRDWYSREMGLELPDDDRDDGWWNTGLNTYVDGFEKNGFYKVTPEINVRNLRRGDAVLMQISSPVPNHAAVYLGEGKILHHVYGRLSQITPYGGYWLKHTTHHLRPKCNA